MEVVVTFTTARYNSSKAFSGVNTLVIRPCPPHMSEAVHAPGCVKGESVTECERNEESITKAFIPEVPWYKGGNYYVKQGVQEKVMPGIKIAVKFKNISTYIFNKCHVWS